MSYVQRSLIFTALNHLRECCFTLEHCRNSCLFLFISRADSESQLCLQHNKLRRVVYFFSMYMQTLSKSYELCMFSCVGSIRGIPSGRGWAHHARSGSQSENRIHLILPACAASYMIKWLTEQDIYWPIICYPISRSQVSTCCLFSTQESNWTIELHHSTHDGQLTV